MRVFLTGATGYLGEVLAEHFSRAPEIDSITGIDLVPPRRPLPEKMRFIPMDVRSPEVSSAMKGHDVVVHTAFIVVWYAKMPAAERDSINFEGTRNVAEAAVANRVRRFVYSSSVAAYAVNMARGVSGGTEDSPLGKGNSSTSSYYANSKAAAERILTEILAPTGITLTILRPTFIIGPRNTATTESLRQLTFRPLGHDHARLQYVHEEDVASAFTQAVLTDMPGAYNVVPDDHLSFSEVQKIVGVKPTATLPVWLARLMMHLSWKYSGSQSHPSWLDMMLVDATSSNAKLRATGWTPKYSTAEALRSALSPP
jgi:nucleoside-diphosphate-sugar epimerase